MASCSSSHSTMEDQLPLSRRFFKVMVPGFQSKLTIPPDFCLKLKGEKSEKGTITKGKDLWNVEIDRPEKGVIIWFGKGWEEFVQKYNLRVGDFAVFEHLGSMKFSVILLDSTGCDKKFLMLQNGEQVQPPQEKKVKSAECGIEKKKLEGDQPLYQCLKGSSEFTARIKEYNVRKRSPYMHIPTEFCQSNALFQNTNITLTGPSGKPCPASLRICNGGKTLYAIITTGWRVFFSTNKLKVGDVCIFQLDRSKSDSNSIAIDVRVV
ncbi:B3 domain-containing protein REM9-like [Lycium barbarum]|uniref:B3 domain-containing protein REM9-like n=1 Tax=Lycium barbarum TaxID=112863 RepID=UPI00293F02C3|nr:B3 domain-containing protein REM9-like [Lycium barbarum]